MRSLVFLALVAFQAPGLACGVCIDDKVASCYDYSVVEQAKARGHEVAFFAIDGSLPVNDEVRAAVLKAVRGASGVRPGTARVSLENAALSFAYDPKRARQARIVSEIDAKLAARGLSLRFLRAMP